MAELREKYSNKIARASFIDLNGQKFLLAPVGIDEGDDVDQKLLIAEAGIEISIIPWYKTQNRSIIWRKTPR